MLFLKTTFAYSMLFYSNSAIFGGGGWGEVQNCFLPMGGGYHSYATNYFSNHSKAKVLA